MIVQMYSKDKTTITLESMQETIEVTCGIRQGCSISTLLFKMDTFCIIEDLESKRVIYEVDKYKGNSLWIADDATLIADSIQSMEKNIEILRTSGREYRLEISEEKSKVFAYKRKRETEDSRKL